MPKMPGTSLISIVNKNYPKIVTILLTGYKDADDMITAIKAGAFSVVTKPWDTDNLKKEFTIKRSWKNGAPLTTQSFDEAQKLMSDIDSLKIVPLKRLKKGEHYQIRAKAELSKVVLPFYLHYVFIFVSLWDFETDLYTIDFIY